MASVHSSALFVPELKQLLARKAYKELGQAVAEVNPVDLAEGWSGFSPGEQVLLFKLLSVTRAVELFEELEIEEQMHLLGTLELGSLGPVLEEVDPREAAVLFHKLPERTVKKMIGLLRKEKVEKISPPAAFPAGTAGGLMYTDILDLRPNLTVHQALERVRFSSRLHRMGKMYTLYVTDDQGRLLGSVSPRALIAAPQDMKLAEIMSPVQLIKVRADSDQEEAARIFSKYKLISAPVVDADNKLLGVLSVDEILHVIHEEATEDIAKMAGTQAEELETANPFRVARLRMPWLITTCLAEVVVSTIVRGFEHTLAQAVALASFMPLIAAMGGNVGTQSSTLCVRGLATGHILPQDWWIIAKRECQAGLWMGFAYGSCVGAVAWMVYGGRFSGVFGVVVGVGVLFSMTVASTMGAIEPFILHHFGMDPAVAVGPLVSTMTDLFSVTAYLSLATVTLYLGWLL